MNVSKLLSEIDRAMRDFAKAREDDSTSNAVYGQKWGYWKGLERAAMICGVDPKEIEKIKEQVEEDFHMGG